MLVIIENVRDICNPFMLTKGVENYVNYCKETANSLNSFKCENYYTDKTICIVQAEIDVITLMAKNRHPNIATYWKKLSNLIPSLETVLDKESSWDELVDAHKKAEMILEGKKEIEEKPETWDVKFYDSEEDDINTQFSKYCTRSEIARIIDNLNAENQVEGHYYAVMA